MRLTHTAMTHNIISVYRCASTADVTAGLLWYPHAHRLVCEWAETYERSIANVACVIAALSPRMPWTRNLLNAQSVLQGNRPAIGGTIELFVRRAQAIRDDRAGDTASYFKQGCKVRCFAVNLAGNYDLVTVDTHGAQIAAGSPAANLRVDTWHKYEPVAAAYVEVARRVKLQPAMLQAIVWLAWKRLYPHKQTQRRKV